MRWEYRVVPVRWDDHEKNWVGLVKQSPPAKGTTRLVGFEAVLEYYGAAGWELVSVLPSGMRYASTLQEALAFFKRPQEALAGPGGI
jgi:hypothetical protein